MSLRVEESEAMRKIIVESVKKIYNKPQQWTSICCLTQLLLELVCWENFHGAKALSVIHILSLPRVKVAYEESYCPILQTNCWWFQCLRVPSIFPLSALLLRCTGEFFCLHFDFAILANKTTVGTSFRTALFPTTKCLFVCRSITNMLIWWP